LDSEGSREQIKIILYKHSSGVPICLFIIREEKELVKLEDTKKTHTCKCIAKILTPKAKRALLTNTRTEQ